MPYPPRGSKKSKQSDSTQFEMDESVLSEDGRLIVEAISTHFEVLRKELSVHLDLMRKEFHDLLEKKSKETDDLRVQVTTLRVQVTGLEERLDDTDAYERRDTIIFSGPAIPQVIKDEDCVKLICRVVDDKLHVKMSPSDISTAHRIGKKPETEIDRRNIIVKLCRRDLKHDIIQACRTIKPDLYVNESLTPVRNTIFYVLRKIKKDFPTKIAGCNTSEGKVYAWVKAKKADDKDDRILVNSLLKLEDICTKIVKKPLSTFIKTWPH